ncbi:hypothetical protein ABT336_00210 [Micromonospora sp. NPDC000207]|uniref:hypothetical protein n=1 Tax=Micromonospora sp. NPDC000207 TaxID=3154246 RepID=UPI003330F9F9
MAVDPVPWFVGGGAIHSPEVARLLAFTAFRGNEGIVGPIDLRVRALSVPGTSVRVGPGAAAILNRAAGGAYQSYAGRITSDEQVAVAATGSGSGRSDLVVLRVEDPYMLGEPWQDPEDPAVGPYVFPRLISGVPNTTRTVTQLGLGYSAIPLARIDLPPSTGTITDGMIVDLRRVANPRRERVVVTGNPTVVYNLTATAWVSAPWTNVQPAVDVPAWAVRAIVRTSINGVSMTTGNAWGGLRARVGSVTTQGTSWDEQIETTKDRGFWRDSDTIAIPAAMRGTTQTVSLEAYKNSGSTSTVSADTATSLDFDIEWVEAAAS